MSLDRRFLEVSLNVRGVANEPASSPAPVNGTQYIVGSTPSGAFASASANDIARYDGSKWKFTRPDTSQLEVLNLDTSEILGWNGTEWAVLAQISGGGGNWIAESHVLTAAEAAAKGFSLTRTVASGSETNVLLAVCGVVQTVGTDFTISGSAVSWANKGLDTIGPTAGDVFVVHYEQA